MAARRRIRGGFRRRLGHRGSRPPHRGRESLPRLATRRDEVTAHLLDLTSDDGGPKATSFIARGFGLDDPLGFVRALGLHGTDHWPGRAIMTRFGEKHGLVGPMLCPDGPTQQVLSVWMVSSDGADATLVTACPVQ